MVLSAHSLLTKIITFFLIISAIVAFLVSTAQADAQTVTNVTASTFNTSEQNQHARVQTLLYDGLSAISCIITGIDPIDSRGCVGFDASTNTYGYAPESSANAPGGVMGLMTNSLTGLYTMPIYTDSYVNHLADNFGIAPNAYAQEQGFNQLDGTLQVWTIFRNLAYLFYILIFIIVGIGVMLRIKIDPRTVMSIQNQIPKMIVGLILITFSYAIAGVLVDLMWTTTYVTIRLAGQVKGQANVPDGAPTDTADVSVNVINVEKTTQDLVVSPLGFTQSLMSDVTGAPCIPSAVANTVTPVIAPATIPFLTDWTDWTSTKCPTGIVGLAGSVSGTVGGVIADLFSPFSEAKRDACVSWRGVDLKACARGVWFETVKFLSQIAAFVVIAFALLIALFRVWWMLLKSFAYIVIYTAISPIYILAGLIPGSQTNFTSWIRGMLANLFVFPATLAFFLGAKIFLRTYTESSSFAPPLTGNPNDAGGFGYIVAFAIIMVTPELINLLRDALKSPPNKYIAPAITGGVRAGAAPVVGGAQMYFRSIMRPYDHISHRPAGWLRNRLVGSGAAGRSRLQDIINNIIGGGAP